MEIQDETVRVRVKKGQGCSSCGCGGGGGGICSTDKRGEKIVQAINKSGAKVGDRVKIEIDPGTILKSSFIAYIIPLLFLFTGGILGHWLSPHFSDYVNPDTLASIFGLIFLGISIVILYYLSQKPKSVGDFRPFVKTVLRD